MKIGSDIVNFCVFYKHDDDTSTHSDSFLRDLLTRRRITRPYRRWRFHRSTWRCKRLFNLPGYSWRRKRNVGDKGPLDSGNLYHTVQSPSPPPTHPIHPCPSVVPDRHPGSQFRLVRPRGFESGLHLVVFSEMKENKKEN